MRLTMPLGRGRRPVFQARGRLLRRATCNCARFGRSRTLEAQRSAADACRASALTSSALPRRLHDLGDLFDDQLRLGRRHIVARLDHHLFSLRAEH